MEKRGVPYGPSPAYARNLNRTRRHVRAALLRGWSACFAGLETYGFRSLEAVSRFAAHSRSPLPFMLTAKLS